MLSSSPFLPLPAGDAGTWPTGALSACAEQTAPQAQAPAGRHPHKEGGHEQLRQKQVPSG